jgi:hypothetical protein
MHRFQALEVERDELQKVHIPIPIKWPMYPCRYILY